MPVPNKVSTVKAALRQRCAAQRERMECALVQDLSWRAQSRVLKLPQFAKARAVGLYSPLGNEVHTQLLCEEALRHGIEVAFPSVTRSNMEFVRCTPDCAWVPGAFGILEPRVKFQQHSECVVPPGVLDVIIVPGVAFDRLGGRLGYGKGFYDRYLPQCRAQCVFIGLAYDFQLEDRLPRERHDVCLDYVVTDARTIDCAVTRRSPSE